MGEAEQNIKIQCSFIVHSEKSAIRIKIETEKNLYVKLTHFLEIILKFMRVTADKICGHHMDMTNTTFICHVQALQKTSTKFFFCLRRGVNKSVGSPLIRINTGRYSRMNDNYLLHMK